MPPKVWDARMVAIFNELSDGLRIGGVLKFPGNGMLLVDGKDAVGLIHSWFIDHPQHETPGGESLHDYRGIIEFHAHSRK